MRRPLFCLSLALLALAGCQTPNPYVASSLPEASVPVLPQQDPAAYPPAPRDWSRYRTWSWAPGAAVVSGGLDGQTVQQAVADGLDQRGLRPALGGARADLQVRARLTQQQRSEQYTDYYDTGYGYGGYGPYGYGPGYGAVAIAGVVVVGVLLAALLLSKAGPHLQIGAGTAKGRSQPTLV
nr:DUF4136 domain-containing protein [uncultured Pseudomonas sp.]